MLHGERLYLTRDQAVYAIRIKKPDAQLLGIPTQLLLCFEEIRWVEYLNRRHLWDLVFADEVTALMWRLAYL